MKIRAGIALFTLVLASCGPSAPPVAEISPANRALQPPPISALIGYRTALELSSSQVVSLDSIGEATRLRNTALFAQLREQRTAPADTTSPTAPQTLLRQIRANNREAAEAVSGVLSDTQRTRACDLFGRSREERMERMREADGRPRSRSRGERADSLFAPAQPWPWCQPNPAVADSMRRGKGSERRMGASARPSSRPG